MEQNKQGNYGAYTNHSIKDEPKIRSSPNEWTTEWLESRVAPDYNESKSSDTVTLVFPEFNRSNVCQETTATGKLNDDAEKRTETVSDKITNTKVVQEAEESSSETATEITQEINISDENNRTDISPETIQLVESSKEINETCKSSERIEHEEQLNRYEEQLNRYEEVTETIHRIHADERCNNNSERTRLSHSSLDVNSSENQEIIQTTVVEKQNGELKNNNSITPNDSNLNYSSSNTFCNEVKLELSSNSSPKREASEVLKTKKFITSSWDLVTIVKLLYKITEPQPPQVLPEDHIIQQNVFILSKGAFVQFAEDYYTIFVKDLLLYVLQEETELLCFPLSYSQLEIINGNTLVIDNKIGRCLYIKCETHDELTLLKEEFQLHSMKSWLSECINLVHYPLKNHQNIVIIDLGSCSTRAGILMDQPTLPTLFFPSVSATNKLTGKHVYGLEALQPEARQNSTVSFPIRPSVKIIKHSIDIEEVTGIFKMIFRDLRIDITKYAVLVCLPRSLSTSDQNNLVKVLLEDLNVQSVSLSHQAILTMYAHNVSTGVVVDIGDRMDILPVIDGFVVQSGVTQLPYGGQRLIHHMKHALAQKHISLSNDLDSFVVQYITENLTYIAEDYDKESQIATLHPQSLRKSVDLQSFALDTNCLQNAMLDDARFKVPEGLFNPDLWGLDCPGVHKLVQKAIQAASVDARKKVAQNIYVSGGVTMIPGFVERLRKEVTILNQPRITPIVYASHYRNHCTYIGACKFARMDCFPRVCVTKGEYSKEGANCLRKFMLCV